MRRVSGIRGAALVASLCGAAILSVALTACGADQESAMPAPTPSVSTSASAPPEAEPAPDPTLLPGGTALANHEYFDFVNRRLLAANSHPGGREIIDNLVAAGFDKALMEVTPDLTDQLRQPVDSIEFSVRTDKDCLLGQVAGGQYHSAVGTVFTGGRCLVGETRTIDW